jgi:hypothetical protein
MTFENVYRIRDHVVGDTKCLAQLQQSLTVSARLDGNSEKSVAGLVHVLCKGTIDSTFANICLFLNESSSNSGSNEYFCE